MEKKWSIKNAFESKIVDEVVDFIIPQFLVSNEDEVLLDLAKKIAEAFDISKCFDGVLQDTSNSMKAEIVKNWNSNVHLLIDKTWVETTNAFFKVETIKALDIMTSKLNDIFCEKKDHCSNNFPQFYALLKNIIHLLFGKEAEQDSLVEYVLRMEPHFGLFCYYIESLGKIEKINEYKARLAMGLAIIFLAEF